MDRLIPSVRVFVVACSCTLFYWTFLSASVLAADFNEVNDAVLLNDSALERKPLFVPGRQAPVIEVAKPEPVVIDKPKTAVVKKPEPTVEPQPSITDLDRWRLIGVMRSSEGDLAILHDSEKDDLHRMKVGESLNGWRLNKVRSRSAVFKNGTVSANIKFDSEKKVPAEPAE